MLLKAFICKSCLSYFLEHLVKQFPFTELDLQI